MIPSKIITISISIKVKPVRFWKLFTEPSVALTSLHLGQHRFPRVNPGSLLLRLLKNRPHLCWRRHEEMLIHPRVNPWSSVFDGIKALIGLSARNYFALIALIEGNRKNF
jgi:hypothetical protein